MKKFKIISTPPGQAPEWVRKQWVGLELPMNESSGGIQAGVLGGRAQNAGGFEVDGQVAIDTLRTKSPEAAQWWCDNAPYVLSAKLVFKQEVCEAL